MKWIKFSCPAAISLLFSCHCYAMSTSSNIENQLETEFDNERLPESFKDQGTLYLTVRPLGFDTITRYTKEGNAIRTEKINHWDLFALR